MTDVWLSHLPLAVWTRTADGRSVQVWRYPDGTPLEVEIDVSDLTPASSESPAEVAPAEQLVQCQS